MRVRTVLAAVAGISIGYVLGTAAGRSKFEELKGQFEKIISDPEVREKLSHLPEVVRENLPKAQSMVNDAIKVAQDKVHAATGDKPAGH